MSNETEERRTLETEACVLGRYLVGRVPPPEVIARYAAANRLLFRAPADRRDAALVRFVGRHPWSVAPLDAASGLLRPDGLLRRKVLLMAAILETCPAFADEFLPRTVPPITLMLRLVAHGLAAVGSAVLGMLLYAAASRSRV